MDSHDGYSRVAHLYDLFDAKENIAFFSRIATGGGDVLDVGAGTGRIAIPIAEQGARVWCVEPSPAMLGEFRRKLGRLDAAVSERITLVEGDASSFRVDRLFAAALMSGSFDHLLDDDERLRSLSNIRAHLEPGGRLVFDIGLGYMKAGPLKPAGEKTVGDTTYRRMVGSKVIACRKLEYLLVFETVRNGRVVERIEQKSFAGIVDRAQVHRLLMEAGLRVVAEFGGYGGAPYHEGDDILIIEAAR